jgi:hypothetical protein
MGPNDTGCIGEDIPVSANMGVHFLMVDHGDDGPVRVKMKRCGSAEVKRLHRGQNEQLNFTPTVK